MRTYIRRQAGSAQVWSIDLQGNSFTVTSGRLGKPGRSRTRTFPDEHRARAAYNRLIRGKRDAGYVQSAGLTADPARRALEDAVALDPDDLGARQAFGDWLAEQGDPRGEFVQVQLALEQPGKTAAERKQLHKRERELLRKYQREWLGLLADHLPMRGSYAGWEFSFARGWLDRLHIHMLDAELARAIVREPQTRLVRELIVEDVAHDLGWEGDEPFEADVDPLDELEKALYLDNVRVLRIGGDGGFVERQPEPFSYNAYWELPRPGAEVWRLIGRMRSLEELSLYADPFGLRELFATRMPAMRILQVYLADDYPLRSLAENRSLKNLTHLALHPRALESDATGEEYLRLTEVRRLLRSEHLKSLTHLRLHKSDLGDRGCAEIVRSGILRRLRFLDLAMGRITDEGARTLARSPDAARLEVLDVSRNCLTARGLAELRAVVQEVRADEQHAADDDEYLYEGEME